jgi:hypothetical protein
MFVLACLVTFALGGAALAGAFDGETGPPVSSEDAARAGAAAVDAAGGGDLLSIERTDDAGAVWEAEVRRDGLEIDVLLDARLRPIYTQRDREDAWAPEEADDQPLTPDEARRAAAAALRLAGGGSVESVERSDDPGEAYEIEVVRAGRELDVVLDENFGEIRTSSDD